MFIELVDALRCPNPHGETWLVLSTAMMNNRHVIQGTLGCPVCRSEFEITDGAADFRRPGTATATSPASVPPCSVEHLAAFLNLSDQHGFAVLFGNWGVLAPELATIVDTPLILINPPDTVKSTAGISIIMADEIIPLAGATARAVAIDKSAVNGADDFIRLAKAGARVVGPAIVPVPGELKVLTRDERIWIAEQGAISSPPVRLHVRRSV